MELVLGLLLRWHICRVSFSVIRTICTVTDIGTFEISGPLPGWIGQWISNTTTYYLPRDVEKADKETGRAYQRVGSLVSGCRGYEVVKEEEEAQRSDPMKKSYIRREKSSS